jgi:hypothetical protein
MRLLGTNTRAGYYSGPQLEEGSYHMTYVARFFSCVGLTLLMITLYELGSGILYALGVAKGEIAPGTSTFYRGIGRYIVLGISGLLIVLSIAVFGLGEAFTVARFRSYDRLGFTSDAIRKAADMRKLYAAIQILFFICSITLVAFASLVMHKAKSLAPYKNVSIISPPPSP